MSFSNVTQLLGNSSMTDKAAKLVFNQIDKDRNGFITINELENLFHQFAAQTSIPKPPGFLIKQAMKMYDTNRDGAISFDEFKAFIYSVLSLQAKEGGHNQGSFQGGNQYQGGQTHSQGGSQYQGAQGVHSDHFPSNAQGIGQGRDAYPATQGSYQQGTQYQGGQGQYQGGQQQQYSGNQYQGSQGMQYGGNQHQGSQGQYQGGQGVYQPQGQYQGANQYQGGQMMQQGGQVQGQYQGGQNQRQDGQNNYNQHFPSNVQGLGQGKDAIQNQYGNHSGY